MLYVLAVYVALTEHFSLQDCGELGATNVMLAHSDGVVFRRGVNGFDPSVPFEVQICTADKGDSIHSDYIAENKQY